MALYNTCVSMHHMASIMFYMQCLLEESLVSSLPEQH